MGGDSKYNSTLTGADVERGAAIFGKAHPISQGKMVRKKVHSTQRIRRFVLLSALLKHHPTDEIDIDFFIYKELHIYLQKASPLNSNQFKASTVLANATGPLAVLPTSATQTLSSPVSTKFYKPTRHVDSKLQQLRAIMSLQKLLIN